MKNTTLTPATVAKSKRKKPHDITPKDMAFERNFTKDGKPKLNATSGERKTL